MKNVNINLTRVGFDTRDRMILGDTFSGFS